MMTREEAKKRGCPYKMSAIITVNIETPEEAQSLLNSARCRAENCPKWRDSQDLYWWCSPVQFRVNDQESFIDKEFCEAYNSLFSEKPIKEKDLRATLECNDCPYRYGYCGG